MTDVPIVVVIESKDAKKGAEVVVRSLEDIKKAARDTDQATGRVNNQIKQTGSVAETARKALIGLAGAFGAREALRSADAYNTLQVRIKTATRDTGDFIRVNEELFRIAQSTGTQLLTNVEVFQRVALGARDLGRTNEDVLQLVDAVQKLGVIGGSSNAALQAGLLQLGQGLSAGILRAEEFNSIIENIPEVANAIAQGLGTTAGQLRGLVLEGKVLSTDVFEALLKQTGDINERFQEIPLNLDRALTIARNGVSRFLASIDQGLGLTTGLAQGIVDLTSSTAALESALIAIGVAVGLAFPQFTLLTGAAVALVNIFGELRDEFPALDSGLSNLVSRLKQVESPFKALRALFITTVGEITKFVNSIGNVGSALVAAFESPFKRIGVLFDAFVDDLQEFARNPFGANGFDNLTRALQGGFVDEFTSAFEKVREEGREFNDLIDQEINEQLLELNDTATDAAGAVGGDTGLGNAFEKAADGATKLKEQADPIAEIYENTANGIKDSFDDLFFDIFRNAEFDARSFLDNFKDLFARTLSELATLAIAKPILIPAIGGLGSALGLSPESIAGVTGQLGGAAVSGAAGGTGGGFGGSLLSAGINKIGGALGGNLLAGTQLGASINAAAATSLPSLFGGLVGPPTAAQAAAGVGIAGGSGTLLATSVIAPIAIAALPLIFSSFFGSDPNPAASFFIPEIDADQPIQELNLLSKHIGTEFADDLGQGINGIIQQLTEFGVDLSGVGFTGGVDVGEGFFGTPLPGSTPAGGQRFVEKLITFDAEDADQVNQAITDAVILLTELGDVVNEDVATALKNIQTEGRSVEEVLSDIQFAATFQEVFGDAPIIFSQMEIAISQLNETFEVAIQRAKELGLNEQTVADARQRSLTEIRKGFDQSIQDQILGIVDPALVSLQQLQRTQSFRRRDALAVGANIVEVERLFALERQQLLEESLQNQSEAFQRGLDGQLSALQDNFEDQINAINRIQNALRLDPQLSGTSVQERSTEADRQLNELLSRIQGGDEKALQDLDTTINQSLNASLDFFGSTSDFLERLSLVDTILDASRDLAANTLSTEEQLLDSQFTQNNILGEILSEISGQTDLLNQQLGAVSADIGQFGGIDASTLLSGDENIDILTETNLKNELSRLIVRSAKVIASEGQFDFTSPLFGPGGQSFAEFVRSVEGGQGILDRFNNIIEGFSGKPQPFANGTGLSAFEGLARVGEFGEELVNFGRPVQIFNNSQSDQLMGGGLDSEAMEENFRRLAIQSSEETVFIGGILQGILSEIKDLNESTGIQDESTIGVTP